MSIRSVIRMAKIIAVCISEKKGTQKHEVPEIQLKVDHGIVGDAHAGNWHRQVSLLGAESAAKLQEKISFRLTPGAFAENILTEGICLYELPVGTRLRLGPDAICEVTQIGKECHYDCAIRKAAGDCVMPREGIFVKVLKEGSVRPGDELEIIKLIKRGAVPFRPFDLKSHYFPAFLFMMATSAHMAQITANTPRMPLPSTGSTFTRA